MKIITYFGFTILSVFIQFCVMDYIQERLQDIGTLDLNVTKLKEKHDIKYINHSSSNQFRKLRKADIDVKKSEEKNKNTTKLIEPQHSIELTSTIMDIFYDENISTTDYSFTTELLTSTEIDNITEINFSLDIKPTTTKPDIKPRNIIKDCNCNLLFEVCDINCCCDNDCSDQQQHFFHCNTHSNKSTSTNDGVCYSYLFHNNDRYRNNILDNMFCIVKINLPEKRQINHKKEFLPHQYFKWRSYKNLRTEQKFTKDVYQIGDPIWLYKNGSISYIDLPCPLLNNYCSKRKAVAFFKDEEIECIVKLKDLEMFPIFNLAEQTKVISATNVSVNSSTLNCSTLYCANWTIFVCDDFDCENYNKSSHEPSCTLTVCKSLALLVDYTFYTHEANIINATIKLYVKKNVLVSPYMSQKIRVKFLITNTSIDEIVKYSGNPGYQQSLRVIISRARSNYTENFYDSKKASDKYFSLPEPVNGQCLIRNITDHFLLFGENKRIKCSYVHKYNRFNNNNDVCRDIQDNLSKLLYLNNTMAVSAYGNPQHSDDEWILLNFNNSNIESVYGKVDGKAIFCFNLITKITLSFAFTNLDEKGNKILSVKHQVVISNKSFTIEDIISTVITIDISFIDVTKPAVFEYASNPHLDINLPKDFFFPSNKSHFQFSDVNVILFFIICCVIIFK